MIPFEPSSPIPERCGPSTIRTSDQCCGGQPNQAKVDEYNRLSDTMALVKARMKSKSPVGDDDVPAGVKAQMKSKKTYDEFYSDAGVWYFPVGYYDAGGGCGACGVGGGGCGGAAGCGGGGCGGGGCGGGGCGG
mmetsp:Transcript_88158/g.132120  ORF Transcript_88158/g.132120 Transcript_88158/m.132120 type:complete len:134 (-) Transcript_88158:178-579(-)